jgi:uncharacterized protein (DUF1800 family)
MKPRVVSMACEAPDREGCWARYEPTAEAPWDLRRVVHLHRRAGFAATWPELKRDLEDGPAASVDRILAGRSRIGGVPDDFESVSNLLADAAVASGDPDRLKAWWIYRMLFSPDPLGERLTLLWHNHFATSNEKVQDLSLMRRQNETHRRLARAPFAELLNAALREPALLRYLDAPANRKGHPNENLARELMELFTLGVGHYTEADVKETARTLTGWTVEEGQFHESASRHDEGPKTILGKTGRWSGSDLVGMLSDHPALARRLAARLCGLLMGEWAVDVAAIDALADGLRANLLDVGWAIETVLRSRAFFAAANLGRRVVGPVELVVGACRALLPAGSPPSTLLVADWIARLGQDLFNPPNVGGWPGGRSWLTSRTIIGRTKFAGALADGYQIGLPGPIAAAALAAGQGRGTSCDDVLDATAALLLGVALSPDRRRRLRNALGGRLSDAKRRAVALVLASPEAQLA